MFYSLVLYLVFAVLALMFLVSFFILRSGKQFGSKRVFDTLKTSSLELKKANRANLTNYAIVSIVLFTASMYAFGWQSAVAFLAGAIILPILDYFLLSIVPKISSRLLEAAKEDENRVARLNLASSTYMTLAIVSCAAILALLTQALFRGSGPLLMLSAAATVSAIFSWRRQKSTLAAVVFAVITVSFVYFDYFLSSFDQVRLVATGIITAGAVFLIISWLITLIAARTKTLRFNFWLGLIIYSILFLATFYFGSWKFFADTGHSLVFLAIEMAFGFVASMTAMLLLQISKIAPAIAVGLCLFASSFLLGTFGLPIVLIGIVAMLPLALVYSLYQANLRDTETLAVQAEAPEETLINLANSGATQIKPTVFIEVISSFLSFSLLAYFILQMSKFSFDLGGQKVLIGLVFGGLAVYLANLPVFANRLLKVALTSIVTLIAGFLLGPIYLAGALAGAVVVNLLMPVTSEEVLLVAVLAVAVSALVENPINLSTRSIIVGAIVVLTIAYAIINKFYGRKKAA